MLKAYLRIRDLALFNPVANGSSVSIGDSYIRPFNHQSLESSLIKTSEQWFFVIRERLRSEDHLGVTFAVATNVSDDYFRRCYQENLNWPLDFIIIEAARSGGRLRVRAGLLGSLPIYFCVEERTRSVALSWDSVDLMRESRAIDAELIAHHLTMKTYYSARQACLGVNLLTAGASLYVDTSDTLFEYGSRPSPSYACAGLTTIEALRQFNQLLSEVVVSRPIKLGESAAELSGGMDSASVAMAVREGAGSLTCGGILLDAESSPKQSDRRNSILAALNCRDHAIEMNDHMPAIDLNLDSKHHLPLVSEYYLEAFEALWGRFRNEGCKIIWSGIGGDELFFRYSGEEDEADSPSSRCFEVAVGLAEGLLTRRGLDAARSTFLFSAPLGVTAATTLLGKLCHARPLAKRGLWPITPLGDPRLINFSATLPLEFRADKHMLRLYLRNRTDAEVFPRDYTKESFELVLPRAIAARADTLAFQLNTCALADLGLVSRESVMTLLNEVVTKGTFVATSALARFIWAERFARQLG
ncbi:asparagine synthase-related protein [Bradyrhizobium sp. CB82]|uniref:asparagine synthase-related protein n=1 Tax=Bradyrhizobium sp. CB82 TaxID=3039159 RepID=UPI0024B23D4B|nr:asparagine synthase-related protein [Bradyrhizobium sp. CB82]WFU40150.1 asparagine synthase-related protein [Bradyrhizobium sp. CB82]